MSSAAEKLEKVREAARKENEKQRASYDRRTAAGPLKGEEVAALAEEVLAHKAEELKADEAEEAPQRKSLLDLKMLRKMAQSEAREQWSWARKCVCRIVESTQYNSFMAFVIVINLAFSVWETDVRASGRPFPWYMDMISYDFLLTYACDLTARIYVYRCRFFDAKMNIFDAFIVASDVVMLICQSILGDIPSLSILRGLRMLRIVRVIRNASAFRELYLMMQGIVSALRAIAFGTVLIIVVLVLFGILAVELLQDTNVRLNEEGKYGDCSRCGEAFATVGDAMLTFMQSIVAGDSWGLLAVPLLQESTAAFFILLPAFISLQLGLLNVVAAVIVDRQAQARLDDELLQHVMHQEELTKSYTRLKNLFASMDDDDSGSLTLEELEESYTTNHDFRQLLNMMDITTKDIELVFGIMDQDNTGDVSYEEFVEQLHYLGTVNQRTLLVFIKHLSSVNTSLLQQLNDRAADATRQSDWNDRGALKSLGSATVVSMVDRQSNLPEHPGDSALDCRLDNVDAPQFSVSERDSTAEHPQPSEERQSTSTVTRGMSSDLHLFREAVSKLAKDAVMEADRLSAVLEERMDKAMTTYVGERPGGVYESATPAWQRSEDTKRPMESIEGPSAQGGRNLSGEEMTDSLDGLRPKITETCLAREGETLSKAEDQPEAAALGRAMAIMGNILQEAASGFEEDALLLCDETAK